MTKGNILKILLAFSFPILIGNIFQQLYNVVDTAVIGNVLGDNSLAALGAASPVYNLVVGFANGITSGFGVVLSRYYGAERERDMKKTIAFSCALTGAISVLLLIGSMFLLRPLLTWIQTPTSIYEDTVTYLQIIIVFSAITMFYNLIAGLLRAIGNSRVPLYSLIAATVVNIVLDIWFVKYLHFGIAGAAYATVIAQGVSVIVCILYILKKCSLLIPRRGYLIKDMLLIKELLTTGISMGLMLVVVFISSVILQVAVNSLGAETIAAHTAARKFVDIFIMPLGTLSMAGSTFVSQNFGAGQMGRVKKGIRSAIGISFAWSGIVVIVTFLFAEGMVEALTGTSSDYVIQTASRYLKLNFPFFFVLSILLVLRSSLQGVGRKLVPIAGSGIELALKIAAVGCIVPFLGYFGICILEPIIWTLSGVVVVIDYARLIKRTQ